jgi:hypothetical protein
MANFDAARFDADIRELLEAMPAHAIVADVPSFHFLPREKQVHIANRLLHAAARERGLTDVPLHANAGRGSGACYGSSRAISSTRTTAVTRCGPIPSCPRWMRVSTRWHVAEVSVRGRV